jgi:hypothetical protein
VFAVGEENVQAYVNTTFPGNSALQTRVIAAYPIQPGQTGYDVIADIITDYDYLCVSLTILRSFGFSQLLIANPFYSRPLSMRIFRLQQATRPGATTLTPPFQIPKSSPMPGFSTPAKYQSSLARTPG